MDWCCGSLAPCLAWCRAPSRPSPRVGTVGIADDADFERTSKAWLLADKGSGDEGRGPAAAASPAERAFVQRLSQLVQDALGKHEPGKHLGEITEACFPKGRSSIWEDVANQTTHLALPDVVRAELQSLKLDLARVEAMLRLLAASELPSQGPVLEALLGDLDTLFERFFNSPSKIHLLCLAVPTAVLHVLLLRHRYMFAKSIYDEDDVDEEALWKDMGTKWIQYDRAFFDLYKIWHEWRLSQIESTIGASYDKVPFFGTVYAFGTVKDKLTRQERTWKKHYTNAFNVDEKYFREVVEEYQRMLSREFSAEIGSLLEPIFYLQSVVGREDSLVRAMFSTVIVGPYHGPKAGKRMATTIKDKQERIEAVRLRLDLQDNRPPVLTGMQVLYNGFDGIEVGQLSGYRYLELVVPSTQYVVGARIGYYDDHIVGLQLLFSESESPAVGYFDPNRMETVAMPSSYELRGLEYLYTEDRKVESLGFAFELTRPRVRGGAKDTPHI